MHRALAAVALAGCSGASERAVVPRPQEIVLSLEGDPRTSLVVEWRTTAHATTTGLLRIVRGEALHADQLGATHQGSETVVIRGDSVIRRAQLRDLSPGTAYTYQVGTLAEAAEYWSPPYTFHTAPDVTAHADAEVVVAVLGGDTDEIDVDQQLVAQVAARLPDVLVLPTARKLDETIEPLTASVATLRGNASAAYGFATIAVREPHVAVRVGTLPPAVVDSEHLERDRATAVVRVRRDHVALDTFGADGTAVMCH